MKKLRLIFGVAVCRLSRILLIESVKQKCAPSTLILMKNIYNFFKKNNQNNKIKFRKPKENQALMKHKKLTKEGKFIPQINSPEFPDLVLRELSVILFL